MNSDREKRSTGDEMETAGKIDVDRLFHALGDPTRRAILDRLKERPLSVSMLAEPLGITLTAVAQHLQILEECGLAHSEKVGRVRTCRIGTAGFDALEQWVRDHRTVWERRINRLGALLDEEGEGPS
jgi:DNA-binding transcriptional ArsR family regulator